MRDERHICEIFEETMRKSRAERLLPFLKMRYGQQLDLSQRECVQEIMELFNKYQTSLSHTKVMSLKEEKRAVFGFLSELESHYGLTYSKSQTVKPRKTVPKKPCPSKPLLSKKIAKIP